MNKTIFSVLAIAVVGMLAADVAMAQRGERSQRGWGRGGGSMGLLNNEQVQSELELVDDQLEQLKAIQDESRQAMRDLFSEMQDVPREERGQMWENLRGKMEERTKKYEERANEILLPHQKTRLKQLSFQSSGRGRGAGGALSNQALLDELGVSDVQREEIEAAAAKAREQLQKKYQKLVEEAEDDILKVLSADQRKKYRELIGDTFHFENGRNRAFGNRGNREGERERRGRRDF